MADPPEKNACDENVLQQEEIVHSEKEQKNRSAQSNQENNVTKIEKVDKTVEINVGDGDLKIEGDESKIGDDENEKKVLEDDSTVEHDKAEQLTEEVLLADSVIEQNETIEEELLLEDDLNVEHSKTDEPEVDSKMEHGTADEALEDVLLEGGSKIEQNNTEESELLKEDSGIKPNETEDMLLRGDSAMETDESIEKALLEDVPEIEQNNENTLDDNLKIGKSLVTSDSNLEFDIKTVEKKKQCRDTTEDKLCATSDVTIEEKEEEKDSVGKEVSEVVDVKKDGEKKASTSHVEDTVSVLSLLDNEDHEGPDALGLLAEAGGRERDVEDDADADDRDCSESEEDSTHDHESEDYPEDEEEDGMPRLYYEDEENLEDDESAMETDAEDKLPGDDVEDGALTPLSDDLVNGQKPEDFGSIIINSAFSINAKEGDGIANLEIVNVASVNEDSLDLSGLDEPSTAFDESSVDMSAYEADRSDLEGEDSTMDKIVDYAGSDAIDDSSCDAEKTAQDDAKADKQEVASISTEASESDCINDNAIVDEFSVNLPKIGAVGSLSTETEKVIEEKEKSISVESKVTDETKEISVETVEPAKITAEIVEESSVRDTELLLDSLDTKDEESVLITESKSNKRKIEAITDAGDDTDEGKAVKKMDLKKIEDEEDVEDSVAEAMRKIEELKLELEKQLKALKSKELANAARMEIEETLAGTKEKTTSKDVEKKGDPVKDQDQPNVVEIGGSCVEDVLNEKTIKEDTEEKTDIPKVIEAIASPDITKKEVTEVKVTTKEPVEVKDDIESKKEVSEDKSEDVIEEKVDTTDRKQSTPPTPQQPIVLPEVYSLDSDDEDGPKIPSKTVEKVEVPLASKETEKPLATKQPEPSRKKLPEASARKPSGIMLKSKDTLTKSKEKIKGPVCGNPRCPNRRVANLPLFPCPGYLLTLYRMRWGSKKERPKVCTNCLRLGIRHIEFLQTKIILGEEIYTAEIANAEDLVEISDSDSDSDIMDAAQGPLASYRKRPRPADAKLLTDSQKQFLAENAPAAFIAVCEKYNIGGIVAEYKERLGEEIIRMLNKTNAFSKQINNLQKSTDKLRDDFYNAFRPNTQEEPEFMIPSPYDAKPQPKIGGRRSVRNRRLVTYANLFKKSAQETEETDPVPEPPADGVTKSVVLEVDTLASLPLIGDLPDTVLQVGDEVLALRQSIFGSWAPAKIIEVWPKGTPLANGTHSLFSLVRVKFDSVSTAEGRGIKQVTGRQIAFPKPALVRYKIGTRVIALFKDRSNVQKKDAYYSGVIAEPPCAANTFRYLVFFDDGYAQYVRHLHTIAVCERSQLVWEDVHPDSRDFIRKYLESYPDRPMVRLQAGQSLKVEWNGKWWLCSVLGVDSSLALLSFLDSQPVGREEWIYRGSTRLAPLYQELQAADRRRRATPNTTNVHNKGTGVPYVEYTRNEDQAIPQPIAQLLPPSMVQNSQAQEAPEAPSTSTAASSSPAPPTLRSSGRSVAKKSTAHNQHQQQQQQQQQQQVAIPIVAPTRNPVSDHSDMKSKVVYYTPKGGLRPKKMRPHTCSRDCISKDTLPLKDLKTYNPLARPLISGWERVIMRYRGKKVIMYRAPCGRRVRTPSELHLYLRLTHSEMSVDLFDFDHQVHCLAEFVPSKCFVSKKDLSHGAEAVAVPCVNYYDHSLPEFCTYSTVRIPTQGVNLNLDEDFLCSCDCTDDCQNKETCQCWQLTMEGARFMGLPANRVGYQYKRLLEPLSTGIYECNSRCKCSKTTCLNRVVQHPLQLKLQVFKTYNRGWGIRALNDVPRGSFLCIYAGNLLTDAVANVDGLNEGDEYLAELDYIEVLERMKEGYESDAKEEDSSSDEEETQKVDKSMVDKDFRPEVNVDASSSRSQIQTRGVRKTKSTEEDKSETAKSKEKADEVVKRDVEALQRDLSIINVDDDFITISDDEEVREPLKFNAPEVGKDGKTSKYRSVRSFFGKDEACYIMDAKVQGNIGRYLNHSCAPNVFVQNVFVDTQDPRFPWVAFFALSHIRAGTELTWNYNYDVGSVPGKVMYCQCGAANCRGRLL